ncbi:MAG: PrgI family protein [Candidatus Uhrbacteria bacterium]|nr:PrgI family protein [Candidatus Uhrbacteria bacterium]
MPEQFVVPQFIDTEDKIFGPVTARQFIILMVVFLIDFVLFRLLSFVPFLILGILLLAMGGIVAFVRINGAPFHYFFLNIIQTFKKPRLRVWSREYSDAELRELMKIIPPPPSTKFVRKEFTGISRLQELTLVVNTGGIYKPEE